MTDPGFTDRIVTQIENAGGHEAVVGIAVTIQVYEDLRPHGVQFNEEEPNTLYGHPVCIHPMDADSVRVFTDTDTFQEYQDRMVMIP